MKTVGRYEILREVGRGGMAMVYLARQTDLDRFVALKELGAFHASDPSFAQRFLRESRVAGSLSHPNICTVHDYFEHDGTPYIAMEYIERGSMRPYVGTMNLAQIGGVLEGLLAGLAHGEQHGIVHRDLKPENLMVTSDGRVKIADFGIAKATNQMQTGAFLTATGTTVGTPTYMAPEQAMAQEIGPPTDLYSVGCMAFEMFTGRVPFHDTEAPMAILLRHVNEQIPSVKSVDPKIDQDISDWIERMLVKDPTKRTQNANDAWDEFEEIIIGLLGPRWRREARLREGSAQFDTPAPLTPAPFKGTTSDAAVSDQFQSFAWGNAVTPDAPAPPGPDTPPPSDSAPLPPEPTVGPPTPAPGPAVGADGSAPESDDGGFVTFGAPAAPEVTPEEPPAAEPAPPVEAEAPAVEEEAPPTEPLTEPQEEGGFETYIAPAPLRPPTDDAPAEAPAIPEPEPAPDPEPVAAAPPPPPPPPPPAPAPAPPPLRPLDEEDDLAKT
ncbi:MAG: serine/threonine-protein kinase, partial [Solirubrobacteraceae bacterium]